jgi:5-methylthioribose kinase
VTIDAATVGAYLVKRGVLPAGAEPTVEELTGGVSGTVLAVRAPGVALVVKQALPRLRVADEWNAPARRTDTEAAALRLAAGLIPGSVPPVVDSDSGEHVVVLQHAPRGWRNWQAELLDGRPHAPSGTWAGDTLGRLHAATAGDAEVAAAFADYEAFALLRLEPYHGAVIERLPRLASALAPVVGELRDARTCLVHGDYAPKNILLGRDGAWILDAEVAHYGNPVFDLAFFLAFPLLTAIEKPALAAACSELVARFSAAYARRAPALVPTPASLSAHTGAMLLARTDGKSPAAFLGRGAIRRARALGERLLLEPVSDLAAVVASCA